MSSGFSTQVGRIRNETSRRLRHQHVSWRHVINRGAGRAYRQDPPTLSDAQRDGVQQIKSEGFVVVPPGSLPEVDELLPLLQADAEQRIAAWDANRSSGAAEEKDYLDELLGHRPTLDLTCPHAEFARAVAPIAQTYFGMNVQVRHFNTWRNRAARGGPNHSQLWHRDRDDYQLCKAFLYLEDVESPNGPFRYLRHSQPPAGRRIEPPGTVIEGVWRATDEDILSVASKADMVDCCGPAGTLVLADTAGLHAGGHVQSGQRLLATVMFTSPAASVRDFFGERPPSTPALFQRGR